jgi:MFS family permease
MVSGLISASFYSLVPAWMQDEGIARETIAIFMLFAVLGGLAFQVPIGRLSDRFDRRVVLSVLSFGFAATAIAVVNLPHTRPVILSAAALLGGFMSTLYPVCVANAHDQMPADQVVAVSGRLILISGLGSILGPLIGTSVKARFGIDGVFYLMGVAGLLLAFLAIARRLMTTPPKHQERTFEILTPQASPLAHDVIGPSMHTSIPEEPK